MKIINKTSTPKNIFLIAFFTLLLSFNNVASAVVLESNAATKNQPNHTNFATKEDDKQDYAPNEIIVKFKSETASALERQIKLKGEAQRSISLAASSKTPSLVAPLDRLNEKYKVKNFTPIFKNFKSGKKRIEILKTRDNFKTTYDIKSIQFTEKEQHLLKRLKRAPQDAKTPDISSICKLTLEKGQSVEEAVVEYQRKMGSDPNQSRKGVPI